MRRGSTAYLTAASGVLLLGTLARAQMPAPPPAFRAGVDLVQIDVTAGGRAVRRTLRFTAR